MSGPQKSAAPCSAWVWWLGVNQVHAPIGHGTAGTDEEGVPAVGAPVACRPPGTQITVLRCPVCKLSNTAIAYKCC